MKLPNLNKVEKTHYTKIRAKKKYVGPVTKVRKPTGAFTMAHIDALPTWESKMREFGVIQ